MIVQHRAADSGEKILIRFKTFKQNEIRSLIFFIMIFIISVGCGFLDIEIIEIVAISARASDN